MVLAYDFTLFLMGFLYGLWSGMVRIFGAGSNGFADTINGYA